MRYGYCRVSSLDQSLERQIEAMRGEGVPDSNIFSDKASGKNFERTAYRKLVGSKATAPLLQSGDVLIILSLDRLGRNYREIQEQWRHITQVIGADIKVLDMPLLDTTNAGDSLDRRFIADLTLQILSYVAEKERENIRKRQAQGIALAKERGVYTTNRKGRMRKHIDPIIFENLYQEYCDFKITQKEAAEQLGVTQATLSRRFKERDAAGSGFNPNQSTG